MTDSRPDASAHDIPTELTGEFAEVVDQLTSQLQAGEPVNVDDFIHRYPEMASEIHGAWESLRQIHQLRDNFSSEPEPATFLGERLGDFQIVREIGHGGMGIVYEAQQLSLGRRVALKVLPFAAYLDPRRLQRFKLEAQAAAALHHNNIVSVYCVGYERGVHYFAMELIDGCSLAQGIEELRRLKLTRNGQAMIAKSIPLSEAGQPSAVWEATNDAAADPLDDTRPVAELITQITTCPHDYYRTVAGLAAEISAAIHYAHEQGIVHRDLKPSNILLDGQGRPWVTDFGLARIEGDPGLTMSGDTLGTLRYMSPEQADGKKLLDHRTDVYSLGVTLYEMLTLRPAYDGANRQELMRQLETSRPVLPSTLAPRLPRDLETIVLTAMQPIAEERYATAGDLAGDLRNFLERRPITAKRSGRLQRALRWVLRHRLRTTMLAVILLLLSVLGIAGPAVAIRYSRVAAALRESEAESLAARRQAESSRNNTLKVLTGTLAANVAALEDVPGVDTIHETLLKDTLAQYNEILKEPTLDNLTRFAIASGMVKLGVSMNLRFSKDVGHEILARSLTLCEQLVTSEPDRPEFRCLLGETQFAIGANQWSSDHFLHSVETLRPLVEEYPAVAHYRINLAWSLQYCASCLPDDGHAEDALSNLDQAEAHWRVLLQLAPDNGEYQKGFAHNFVLRAQALKPLGNLEGSLKEFERAMEIAKQAAEYLRTTTRGRIGYGHSSPPANSPTLATRSRSRRSPCPTSVKY